MRPAFRQRLNHALGEDQELEAKSLHVALLVIEDHAWESVRLAEWLPASIGIGSRARARVPSVRSFARALDLHPTSTPTDIAGGAR